MVSEPGIRMLTFVMRSFRYDLLFWSQGEGEENIRHAANNALKYTWGRVSTHYYLKLFMYFGSNWV